MVAFLNANNHFIRHAAESILIFVSHFLIKYECFWVKLLQSIWFILEDAVPTIFSGLDSSASAINRVDDSLIFHEPTLGDTTEHNFQFARFSALMKFRLFNVNKFVVVHLFQTLRNILKSLKHEPDDVKDAFIQNTVSSLLKMPWDMLMETFNSSYTKINFQLNESDTESSRTELKTFFLGAILQLCCSLTTVYDLETDGTGHFKEVSVYSKFCDLVPKLLSCCFINHLGNTSNFLCEYLRHKSLIMMIRLSFHSHWKIYHPRSWLELLRKFFGEFLIPFFLESDTISESCLEEFPFFLSSFKKNKYYGRHLQRLAIYLLLKCSFTVACSSEVSKECPCIEETTFSSFGLQHCRKHCTLGLLETFAWLQRCCPLDKLPLDKLQNCTQYSDLCNNFTASFLLFYLEEDDMLFKILLQLLDAPFSAWQKGNSYKMEPVRAINNMLRHLSCIFCPIRIFHLFLLLLQYDHLLLVDYLISKDTGIYCLQYFMRCLRLIHNSWPAFMQFTILENESGRYYKKRRKDHPDEDKNPAFINSATATFQRQSRWKKNYHFSYEATGYPAFDSAKGCLLSLKVSLGELQRKDLFPYNSKPLLKSLSKFLELCMTPNPEQHLLEK